MNENTTIWLIAIALVLPFTVIGLVAITSRYLDRKLKEVNQKTDEK